MMDDKISKVVFSNYLKTLPTNLENDLRVLINMCMKSSYVIKGKVKAIVDSVNPQPQLQSYLDDDEEGEEEEFEDEEEEDDFREKQ